MNEYVSLVEALAGQFNKPLAELPEALRERVDSEFPMPWDKLTSEQRQSLASEIDAANNPAEQERKHWAVFFEAKGRLENARKELASLKPATITEQSEKEKGLKAIDEKLEPMERRLARGDCPPALNPDSDEYDAKTRTSTCQPVFAAAIRKHFRVLPDEAKNEKWWKERMRNVERCGLLDCRVGEGKRGRWSTTLWRPDLIAHWLVARNEKGREGLGASKAADALRNFAGCEEAADDLQPTPNNG